MALSCGGGGGASIDLNATDGRNAVGSAALSKGTGVVVTEEEIATLPAWQQELLSDPGWNQPYITPREGTPIEAPTFEMLLDATRESLEAGVEIVPRTFDPGNKNASWTDQQGFAGETVVKGEYPASATPVPGPNGNRDAIPLYGCNNDGSDESAQGNAIEDLIDLESMPLQRISYVLEGLSTANYFNATGGSGNDMQSAVYQLFADDRDADPTDPASKAQFAELSYNAGLLGEGIGPGGDCNAAEAFQVEGKIWRRFNASFNATPGLNATPLYNIFIAPSGELSNEIVNVHETTARWQPFYFGTVSSCYGGAAIVNITASTGGCDTFNENLTIAGSLASNLTYSNPVYGVLMQRWVDMNPGAPWDSALGWPVYGPRAFAGGSPVLTALGQYYAWGLWFERGFIWWIDYDQNTYPDTSDEAQLYFVNGDNVYCDNEYIAQPTVFYGGAGDLAVNVVLESYSTDGGANYTPLPFNGTNYELALPADDGLAFANVKMFASATGGNTQNGVDVGHPDWGDCLYKYYVWAFRNGTIQSAGTPYDPSQRYAQATYGSPVENRESMYTVRVQVTDASKDLGLSGTEVFAYGDSFMLHVGHGGGGGGGGGEILVVRNDGGNFNANWDALLADLDELGAAYTAIDWAAGTDDMFFDQAYKVCIWYRGGAGAAGENNLFTAAWNATEYQEMFDIVAGGGKVLNFSQAQADTVIDIRPFGWTYVWQGAYGCVPQIGTTAVPHQFGMNEGLKSNENNGLFVFANAWGLMNGNQLHNGGNLAGLNFGAFSTNAPERYNGAGSSGDVPISFNMPGGFQFGSRARYQPFDVGGEINPGWSNGIGEGTGGFLGGSNITWSCSTANPGGGWASAGPGRYYCAGFAWNSMAVAASSSGTMVRSDVLQNVLAWADPSLTFGGGGGGGGGSFSPYDDVIDNWAIVQIKPVFWNDDGTYVEGAASSPLNFPDPTGTDAFRSTANVGAENYVVRSSGVGNEDGLNGNDFDFQHPFYGYHHYGADGITGLPGDPAEADDTYFVGGMCVINPDLNGDTFPDWRLANSPDPGLFGTPPGEFPVSNYYFNDSTIADGATRATYGSGVAHLAFNGRDGVVSFEGIARWPGPDTSVNGPLMNGAVDAYLRWSLYPGHGVFNPATLLEYGVDTPWPGFLTDHDIDPNGINSVPTRDMAGWLRPVFLYPGSGDVTYGRIVEFDYRDVDLWKTDFNGSGTFGDNPGDKFPVRARLVTDWSAYLANNGEVAYPNHFPDASSYLEMGCYVVDTSEGDPGLELYDDAAQPDPGFGGTFDNTAWPNCTMDLFYGIDGGTPNYTIDFCWDFDPSAGIDDIDSFAIAETNGTVVLNIASWATEGLHASANVPFTPTAGSKIVALRATDNSAPTRVSVLWYAEPVTFGPPMSLALLDDPLSVNSRPYDNLLADLTGAYGASNIDVYDLATTLGTNALDGYTGIFWGSDGTSASTANFSAGSGSGNFTAVLNAVSTGTTLFVSGAGAFNLANNPIFSTMIPWSGSNFLFTDGDGGPNTFINGVESLPEFCGGWDSWHASPSVPTGRWINFFSTVGVSTKAMMGWINTPDWWCGGYRTDAAGGGGAAVAQCINYGDLLATQSTNSREQHLVNLLCMGNPGSIFNPDFVPPPPLPFFDDFETDMSQFDVPTPFSWIAGAPSQPGTYPATSGSQVARLSAQPYANSTNVTFMISGGGRTVPTGMGGMWSASYRYNGSTESGWDYMNVDVKVDNVPVASDSFTGTYSGAAAEYKALFSAPDNSLVNMVLNFSADSIITAYGPQIDDINIQQVDSRTAIAQETFDPVNAWNGSAQFSSDNPAIAIGSPNWQNNAAATWSSPPHYGYRYDTGPTFNGFSPFDDTWAIDDVDGTQICLGWGDDAGDADGERAMVYSCYMATADGFSVNHLVGSNWRTGGYNNKVFAVGPFDFSNVGYFTDDPVVYVRVYHTIFSTFWLSNLWLGWDNVSNPPGWTGDPLTPSGLGGTGLFAPAWNYSQLVGQGQPIVGTGGDFQNGGSYGDPLEGDIVEIPLVGAAGQSNVYITGCLHSSESLGDSFIAQETTILDGFTVTLGDTGNGPPSGF